MFCEYLAIFWENAKRKIRNAVEPMHWKLSRYWVRQIVKTWQVFKNCLTKIFNGEDGWVVSSAILCLAPPLQVQSDASKKN